MSWGRRREERRRRDDESMREWRQRKAAMDEAELPQIPPEIAAYEDRLRTMPEDQFEAHVIGRGGQPEHSLVDELLATQFENVWGDHVNRLNFYDRFRRKHGRLHDDDPRSESNRPTGPQTTCTSLTAAGAPCQAPATQGLDDPETATCIVHSHTPEETKAAAAHMREGKR